MSPPAGPGRAAPRIALATAAGVWPDDEDGELTEDALRAAGADASPQVWDDPTVDWAGFDLVVIRSTWDYVPQRPQFLAWTDRVSAVTTLANPAPVVRWNTDKRYLDALARDGVAAVTTYFLSPDDDGPAEDHARTAIDRCTLDAVDGSGRGFVVKPTVSAGSKDTTRYGAGDQDAGVTHAVSLLGAGRDVMVQPYMDQVDTAGETGLVYFGGRFSHALRKGPLLRVGDGPVGGLFASETIDPRSPSPDERSLADRVLAAAGRLLDGPLLYARVDLLPGPDGPVLLELELTEPSFFLAVEPDAPARMAAAFMQAARAARS